VDPFLDVALRSERVKTAVACLRAPVADTLPDAEPRLTAALGHANAVVREAIASIQSRLVGAGHGQLALAADGGEVSLTDDAAGRVTVEDAS
jgi:hypothetical protein